MRWLIILVTLGLSGCRVDQARRAVQEFAVPGSGLHVLRSDVVAARDLLVAHEVKSFSLSPALCEDVTFFMGIIDSAVPIRYQPTSSVRLVAIAESAGMDNVIARTREVALVDSP